MNHPYRNIKESEIAVLATASHEENGGDLEKTAHDVETIDIMLGVMRMKSLLSSRDKRAKSKFSRGRGFKQILENIITRES